MENLAKGTRIWPRIVALINNAAQSHFSVPPAPNLIFLGLYIMGLLFHTDAWKVGRHAQFVLLNVCYLLSVLDSTEEGRLQMAVILCFTIFPTSMSIHGMWYYRVVCLSKAPSPYLPFAIVPMLCSLLPWCDLPFLQCDCPHWSLSWLLFPCLGAFPVPLTQTLAARGASAKKL